VDYCQSRDWQLILVDDGSTDQTGEILAGYQQERNVTVLHHSLNRGYGGALKTGILAARTPYTVTIDGDGQHNIEDVELLLAMAIAQGADMVIGSRKGSREENAFRTFGKWIIRNLARLLVPLSIYDLNSGFKLYRTGAVQEYLELCPDTMAFSDTITLVFIHERHLVLECPIQVNKRTAGSSTINLNTAFNTVINILYNVMMFNPLRIFLPIAFFCILFGVAWGIPILLRGRGVSTGSMLAIISGLLTFLIGLIANQLSEIRLQINRLKQKDSGARTSADFAEDRRILSADSPHPESVKED
jgi:glycosyltransferase involved in cell wall biosynthesis